MSEILERAKAFLFARKTAYNAVFRSAQGEVILRDLARFCRAHDTTFVPDDRASALMEGRREVWLRIQHHLQLSEAELWDIYQQPKR